MGGEREVDSRVIRAAFKTPYLESEVRGRLATEFAHVTQWIGLLAGKTGVAMSSATPFATKFAEQTIRT